MSTLQLLTVPQIAEVLNVPRFRAYEMCRTGMLPVVRIGRQVRVAESALKKFIEQGGRGLPDDKAA